MDARDHAVYENDLFSVGPHRKSIAEQTYICVPKTGEAEEQFRTFMDVLEKGGAYGLAALFDAVANAGSQCQDIYDHQDMSWLVNVSDDRVTKVNNTYAQNSAPHMHILMGALRDEFSHVAADQTFAPYKKSDLWLKFFEMWATLNFLDERGKFQVYEVPRNWSKADKHFYIYSKFFDSFQDFTRNASRSDLYDLNKLMKKYLAPEVEQGGARLIYRGALYKEPHDRAGNKFALDILGGDMKQKWFEPRSAP